MVRGFGPFLDEIQQGQVFHYLEHGEPEMAFELLCLCLMPQTIRIERSARFELLRIGRSLSLDV